MSRMAQQFQAMLDQQRKQKKGRRDMVDVAAENLGGENLGGAVAEDVNSTADAGAAVGIEPDEPAGAEAMDSKKKAAKSSKAKKVAGKKAGKVKPVTKPVKPAKVTKPAKTAKVAKEAKPKVVIGGLPDLKDLKLTGIEGGDRNQFVNLTFSNGHGFKLWPSGYAKPADRLKARDLMVAYLSKHLL